MCGSTMGSLPILMMARLRLGEAQHLAQIHTAFHDCARPGHHASLQSSAVLRLKQGLLTPEADPSSHARPLDAHSAISDLLFPGKPSSVQQPDLQSSQAAQIFTQRGL